MRPVQEAMLSLFIVIDINFSNHTLIDLSICAKEFILRERQKRIVIPLYNILTIIIWKIQANYIDMIYNLKIQFLHLTVKTGHP